MAVEVYFKNDAESKIAHLIALLRSMDFVERVKITPDAPVRPKKELTFFEQFYGKTNSGLTIDEIDEQLKTLRQEWDRDI